MSFHDPISGGRPAKDMQYFEPQRRMKIWIDSWTYPLHFQEEYVSGIVQLYSVDTTLTQCISAHAVTFAKYRFEGNKHSSSVLCVAARDCDNFGNGKVIQNKMLCQKQCLVPSKKTTTKIKLSFFKSCGQNF